MNKAKLIRKAQLCPYCEGSPKLTDSSVVYGRSYGPIWLCECGAFCGCHPGTNKPLGMVANQELRTLRKECHFYFDQIWQEAVRKGASRTNARNITYSRLAALMGIQKKYMHFAMLDEEECRQAIKHCIENKNLLL